MTIPQVSASKNLTKIVISSKNELWEWLDENHSSEQSFLLVTWKKTNTAKYISRDAVLDALLAYGWIDGRRYALDKDRTMQLICKRKQQNWTQTYRNRVEKLLLDGKLQEAGLATMMLAQQNGTWLANQNVDNLETPDTLLDALDVEQGLAWWQSAALSYKRNVLRWLNLAKTDETRQKRINAIAKACRDGQKIKNL
jgi:uncharacterized protein YdeI (YjbR/CyaY-like superfamily)